MTEPHQNTPISPQGKRNKESTSLSEFDVEKQRPSNRLAEESDPHHSERLGDARKPEGENFNDGGAQELIEEDLKTGKDIRRGH